MAQILKITHRFFCGHSLCMLPIKHFLLNKSVLVEKIRNIFNNEYGITDIFVNDVDAIYARIAVIQAAELREILNYYASTLGTACT